MFQVLCCSLPTLMFYALEALFLLECNLPGPLVNTCGPLLNPPHFPEVETASGPCTTVASRKSSATEGKHTPKLVNNFVVPVPDR
ncbi:hypothetical protein C8R48DRAFT_725094 [Suillus tomentosus]|nr:hypothetical protein C8R48DRAFT_725094 [Suillus tomentosus]